MPTELDYDRECDQIDEYWKAEKQERHMISNQDKKGGYDA